VKRLLADWGIAIAVALLLIGAASLIDKARQPSGAAPALNLANIAGGTTSLAALQGQVVVVNFWGSWCGPCRSEIPEISAFAKEHPEVKVLGVAVRSGRGKALAESAARLGVSYDVLEGDDPTVDAWRVSVFPTTFVVDAKGEIRASRMGTLDRDDLEDMVDRAAD
jgi:thiol-disulfide isomerase/thioredoxin